MTDQIPYDWEDDAKRSWELAVACQREQHLVDTIPGVKQARVIGQCELLEGDCLEVMPLLGKVDAVLMDPPYGLGDAKTEKNNYSTFSDTPDEVFELVSGVIEWGNYERLVMTPGQKMMFRYKEPTAIGAYYYPAGSGSCSWGFVGWQPIFYYGKDPFLQDGKGRAANCFQSTESAEKNNHPCPKPIAQWTRLLKRISRPNETILDPFMGSGTTLVACAKLGRRGIGIELDPEYFDIAVRRVEEAYRQPDLFVDQPASQPTQEGLDR